MANLSVGKDVLAFCNKCKLTLSHIIVTMKDVKKIHKVECNTCKHTHAYKDPSASKVAKKRTTARRKSQTLPLAEVWRNALDKAQGASIPYSIKTVFAKGDVINHPKFGDGVVEAVVDNDKISIIFQSEIKVLIHGR